jgi:hypothetical protein
MRHLTAIVPLTALTLTVSAAGATRHIAVENNEGLELVRAAAKRVDYKGHKALQIVGVSDGTDGDQVALVKDLDFKDGSIEVDLAGVPGPSASDTARGFVGVAFHAAPHATAIDCIYLRPTNGRADDQLRRNHSTQYISHPAYPWERLRSETPGVYESYVDLETGAWTHVRITVSGVHARLYVNGAAQPTLIVNDLKRGALSGAIGLWIGPGTEAYFRNLQITTE